MGVGELVLVSDVVELQHGTSRLTGQESQHVHHVLLANVLVLPARAG